MQDKIIPKLVTDASFTYIAQSRNIVPQPMNKLVSKNMMDLCLYRVDEVSFEEDAPRKEALENVLSSLRLDGIFFLFFILGDKQGVHFYYGIARDYSDPKQSELSIMDIGEEILKPSIQGNFRGSHLTSVSADDKRSIVNTIGQMKYSGLIEGVPGSNKDDEKFQGVDRLVDVMLGDEFAFVILAKPLDINSVLHIRKSIYDIYTKIAPFAKQNLQSGANMQQGTSSAKTTSNSKTRGENSQHTSSSGRSDSKTHQYGTSKATSDGRSESNSSYTKTHNGQQGSSESKGSATGTNSSTSDSRGESSSVTTGTSNQDGKNESSSVSANTSVEFVNKEISDWIRYFDEVLLPRLDYGMGKGLFVTTIAMLTNNRAHLMKLQNTAVSLYAGEVGNRIPMRTVQLDRPSETDRCIRNFQIPVGKLPKTTEEECISHAAVSHVVGADGRIYLGNWITTNELGVVAGLPQKEVVGLCLKEEVDFGLNIRASIAPEDRIELGNLIHSGHQLRNNKVYLSKKVLNQHVFVSGVTGSGKTTTCQKILCSAQLPFMVIEPAKTEYRVLQEKFPDLLVFSFGKSQAVPFRLNPFEFLPHESITSRVDMIKACIEAAFDMEAAIPQIIEAAIYQSYEDYGWNIATNENTWFTTPFDCSVNAFPTLQDLIDNAVRVVERQGFDSRLKDDYIGSINARLQGLMVGSKGAILNVAHSVDFEDLLNHRVVLELEEIRSGSEKSLMMGFILINLIEAIKAKYLKTREFRHITLVEEAHRLLSRFQPGDHPNKRHGVEMFADMLAEIRKYGESLIIADQIPNQMTPEVLKNTNTKIIHRLFAADDKEAVGNTVMLNRDQKDFLSNLENGQVVFFSQGMDKAVQVAVTRESDTSAAVPSDQEIQVNTQQYYCAQFKKGLIAGFELLDKKPSLEQFHAIYHLHTSNLIQKLLDHLSKSNSLKKQADYVQRNTQMRNTVNSCLKEVGEEFFFKYLRKYGFKHRLVSQNPDEEKRAVELIKKFLSKSDFSVSEISEMQDIFQPGGSKKK